MGPPPASAHVLSLRRAALLGMLGAKIVGGWGLGWDIRWHILIGRDSFWIAPHLLTYFSVLVLAALSFGVLTWETWRARSIPPPPDTFRLAGLVGTAGFHLAWWGVALTLLAAPIDDLWHRLFGIDVTLWSLPHLLGIAGVQVNTLACALISLEVWPARPRARRAALLVSATLLLGLFEIVADPAVQTTFVRGPAFFFAWPALGALLFTVPLVLAARLGGGRAAPLAMIAIGLVFQISTIAVTDAGFALTRPTPDIEGAIRENPTSPIAIAHEMARRSGTTPGRRSALRLVALIPAAAMVVLDAQRRWRLASLAFGATLMATSGAVLARSPALAHALPGPGETLAAMPVVLGAALLGGAIGAGLATAITRSTAGPSPTRWRDVLPATVRREAAALPPGASRRQ